MDPGHRRRRWRALLALGCLTAAGVIGGQPAAAEGEEPTPSEPPTTATPTEPTEPPATTAPEPSTTLPEPPTTTSPPVTTVAPETTAPPAPTTPPTAAPPTAVPGPAPTTTAIPVLAGTPALDDDAPKRLADGRVTRSITFPVVGGATFVNGWNDCRDDCARYHAGTDVMANKLQPLVSPVDGVVVRFIENHRTAGDGVVIEDDAGYQWMFLHVNNDRPFTDDGNAERRWQYGPGIEAGARVVAGQLVGFVGDSGNAEGYLAHVHVELRRPSGTRINPYWSLAAARFGGLHCAPAEAVTDEWLNVQGVRLTPLGFVPVDRSLCVPGAPAPPPPPPPPPPAPARPPLAAALHIPRPL